MQCISLGSDLLLFETCFCDSQITSICHPTTEHTLIHSHIHTNKHAYTYTNVTFSHSVYTHRFTCIYIYSHTQNIYVGNLFSLLVICVFSQLMSSCFFLASIMFSDFNYLSNAISQSPSYAFVQQFSNFNVLLYIDPFELNFMYNLR